MPRLSEIPKAEAQASIVASMYKRLFEIAAPADYNAQDVGRQISYAGDDERGSVR